MPVDTHIAPVRRAIDQLRRLPGIGPKAASQIVFKLLEWDNEDVRRLADSLVTLVQETRPCPVCGQMTDIEPCRVCRDESRDRSLICVVEHPLDVVAIERSSAFTGLYHVLGGAISPLEGVGPDDLRVDQLMQRLQQEAITEVILATNPTREGDATSLFLENQIAPLGVKVSKVARGLPMGSEMGFADSETLTQAFRGRTHL